MPQPAEPEPRRAYHIPGEPGIWVMIVGDLLVFSVMFISFMVTRREDRALFHAAAGRLNQTYGLINTVLLLTSSWLVASAVQAARDGKGRAAARCFRLGSFCAVGFVAVKVFEYAQKVRAGLVINTDDFYMYYYVLTGIHLMHVLVGLGLLIFMARYVAAGALDDRKIGHLESGATFWHLVDLLWIALFALLYLLQ